MGGAVFRLSEALGIVSGINRSRVYFTPMEIVSDHLNTMRRVLVFTLGMACGVIIGGCGNDSGAASEKADSSPGEPTVIEGYRGISGQPLRLELIYETGSDDRMVETVVTERGREVAVTVRFTKALERNQMQTADLRHGVVTISLARPLGIRRLVTHEGARLRRWMKR